MSAKPVLEYVQIPTTSKDCKFLVFLPESGEMQVTIEEGSQRTLKETLEAYMQMEIELIPRGQK